MTALTLVLNEGGLPQRWATWQEAVIYKAKDLIQWEMGESDWIKYGGISRITGEQSSAQISSIIAVKGMHLPARMVPVLSNRSLFGRDLNICAYCGNSFRNSDLTNDHIIPRARGGKHIWTNCVSTCKRCNNKKGDKLLKDISMDLLYIPYVPSFEEVLILKNRNILCDQMQYMKKSLPKHSRLLIL